MTDHPYLVDIAAIRADLRTLLDSHPVGPSGCPLCGSKSVCHNCRPQNAARARLKLFAAGPK